MNLRKSGYEIEVKGEDVSRLEEKMLESGLCNFVVPMWISREGDKVKINYECSVNFYERVAFKETERDF